IENPIHGDFRTDHEQVQRLLREARDRQHLVAGFLLGPKSSLKDVQAFIRRNKERQLAFYHMGSAAKPERINELQGQTKVAFNVFLSGKSSAAYRRVFTAGKAVILEDPFGPRERNEDYPPHEFYSDRHKTFISEGFFGFGDFLIVGNQFKEKGGAALAVAIHLTNLESDSEVWIRHFLSDRTSGRGVDPGGKFLEALEKTVAFIKSKEIWRVTEGCRDFLDLYSRQHYPGLGAVKKISMKHHLELMNALLQ
ncbi:MAG TPA: sce7725 family protein, partial [Thermoanaerobaculia bacterium]|nr:sce7725 family protein [Thermoanaerobaculia bacterium]